MPVIATAQPVIRPRAALLDLIYRCASEPVRGANDRAEQLAHVDGGLAVGENESHSARDDEAASGGRPERAREQRLRLGAQPGAVRLGPQAVADVGASTRLPGH